MWVQKLNIICYNFKVEYALSAINFYTINNNYSLVPNNRRGWTL